MSPGRERAAMRQAIALARRGWGRVHPNPLVGAVVLSDDRVVGTGWHAELGQPHAERIALDQAGDAARAGTLVVSLEPCQHQGRQPPCVARIIEAGISRVVFAIADPNPTAAGGAATLAKHGIEVVGGILTELAAHDNFRFLGLHRERNRPFVALKLAMSIDGFIADCAGHSQWISGAAAREWTHWLRAGFGGVAVGAATAIADDARLTVRGPVQPLSPPARVLFDRGGRLPASHGILADAGDVPVVVIQGTGVAAKSQLAGISGVTVIAADSLEEAMTALYDAGIDSLLVEGGGRLAAGLIAAGLVDRVYQVQAPFWLGGGTPAWAGMAARELATAPRWHRIAHRRLGDDTLLVLER